MCYSWEVGRKSHPLLGDFHTTFDTRMQSLKRWINVIQRINLHPVDGSIGFPYTYPRDSELSGGKHYPMFKQLRLSR